MCVRSGGGYLHVLGGDLCKAVGQLGDQRLVTAGQQATHLLSNPPIVQQALGGGGRQRGGERQLVQHCTGRTHGRTRQRPNIIRIHIFIAGLMPGAFSQSGLERVKKVGKV